MIAEKTASGFAKWTATVALLVSAWFAYTLFSKPIEGVMNWDVTGYYMYWPATLIYDDLEMKSTDWAEDLRAKYDLSGTLYQFHGVEDRNTHVNQYSAGMAVMYTPAFWIGHWAAKVTGQEQDGFSPPYQMAIAIWSLMIAMAGIWFLRLLLLHFFTDATAAWIMLLMSFGTSYFIQIKHGLATPHNYLFFFYVLFILATIRWHQNQTSKNMALLAAVLGIMCLIRPTELLAVFIALGWNARSIADIKRKVRKLFGEQRKQLVVAALVMFCIGLPQLLYWKFVTGHFFFMSYTNPGEGFDFLSPHTIDFLFSYRKGWFIYSPLMAVALFGFVYLWKKKRELFWGLAIFFLLNLYITSSWSCWWYAQCFSQRGMVQSLPVMALLLGFAWLWFQELGLVKWILSGATAMLFVLSVFFAWQYEHGILDQWRMTKDYFYAVFLKTDEVADETKDLLLVPREFSGAMVFADSLKYALAETDQYSVHFMDEMKSEVEVDSVSKVKTETLNSEHAFTKALKRSYRDWTCKSHAWFKVSASVFIPEGHQPGDVLLVATADHKGPYGYRTSQMPDSLFKSNGWNTITIDYLTPEVRSGKDDIAFYVWYRGNDSVFVRDVVVRKYERGDRE
jgi:hypothetical protein